MPARHRQNSSPDAGSGPPRPWPGQDATESRAPASTSPSAGWDAEQEPPEKLHGAELIDKIKRDHARSGSLLSRPCAPGDLSGSGHAGFVVDRPRPAMHSGDFRGCQQASQSLAASTAPLRPFALALSTSQLGCSETRSSPENASFAAKVRSRAVSHSVVSLPCANLPSTSPLARQATSADVDMPSRPASRERSSKRHTVHSTSFKDLRSTYDALSRDAPQDDAPRQALQPRRSASSLQLQCHSVPPSPLNASRRPSLSDSSPLQRAPMVGSYEESILRGRMSSTPSRPVNFLAQIGVLGKGQCPPSLRCPAHVTAPFPAFFFTYGDNGRIADGSPSPYVGLIDLESSLSPAKDGGGRKRRHTMPAANHGDDAAQDLRMRQKVKRRTQPVHAPPGGSYRIPQQGQLQIIIKNPQHTAVKLFLVPYDLSDMQPGQKTFVRQRSYSAGPVIDMPLSCRKNVGTDRPEAALSTSDDPADRPMLRYLVHVHICCPARGRFFLYKSIRVVFANRVMDDQEKLRLETQLPEPRYSSYKPSRDAHAAQSHRRHLSDVPEMQLGDRLRIADGSSAGDAPPPSPLFPPLDSSASAAPSAWPSPVDPIPFCLSRTGPAVHPSRGVALPGLEDQDAPVSVHPLRRRLHFEGARELS